jgi:hypothetical protein
MEIVKKRKAKMPRPKVSRNRIKRAIPGSGGIISRIAQATGYSWITIRDRIEKDEELSRLFREEEEKVDDLAESVLIRRIQDGDEATARWWLARRRRSRYGDNVDLTSAGGALVIRVVYEDEDDKEQ